MDDDTATVPQAASDSSPFVGLRPFERDDRWRFFGRERDATLLCDKILGARLTLFYAQSGLGKSSLLRTLIVPQLEKEDCLVLYHDAWTMEHPAAELNAAIAAAGGLPAAGGTLLETVRAAQPRLTGRTLVLLLDQFEEFLIAHPQRLEPLRGELGALLRARDLDLRIVLSLREELLAALDPFRQAVGDLYQSTYRLEPLGDAASRQAIVGPVERVGATIEAGLVDRLLRDLRGESEAGDAVDLPMLQLVGRELWSAAGGGGGRPAALTETLYASTGGARAILDRLVLAAMPKSAEDRVTAARLLQLLAPPSGFKASYSLEDLAASTELPLATVKATIDALGRAQIVRARAIGRSTRYELQHDAFIRILAPWRDAVLASARRSRRRRRVAAAASVAAAVLLVIAAAALPLWQRHRDDARDHERQTSGAFAVLRTLDDPTRQRRAESTFNSVTSYLLYQDRRAADARFQELRRLLRENVDLLPRDYGIERAPAALGDPLGAGVVEVRHATTRALDAEQFRVAWQSHAGYMASAWGVPLPPRVRVRAAQELPPDSLRILFPGEPARLLPGRPASLVPDKSARPPIELRELPLLESEFVVIDRPPSDAAGDFIARYRADWRPLPEIDRGGPWLAIPRWALPVWRAADVAIESGSRLPALLAFREFQRRPAEVISAETVEVLLTRVEKRYPRTVEEARAARGDRLAADLAALVKAGDALTGLPLILDELAAVADTEPDAVAARLVEASRETNPIAPARTGGPRAPQAKPKLDEVLLAALREVEPQLPAIEGPIRVDFGRDLVAVWFQDGDLRPQLRDRLEAVRETLLARYGVVLPGTSLRDEPSIPTDSFSIMVLNQTSDHADAQPVQLGAERSLAKLEAELTDRAEAFRRRWITADYAESELDRLDERTREWLHARYSLSDLKFILRVAAESDALTERSLPPHAVLLSLPFWSAVVATDDLERLAEPLDRMRSGLVPRGAPPESRDPLARGIDALFADDPETAHAEFARLAGGRSRDAVVDRFAAEFRRRWLAEIDAGLAEHCAPPFSVRLTVEERIRLAELVADGADAARRAAALCLLAEMRELKLRSREQAVLAALGARHRDVEAWPSEEAEWLARRIVDEHRPLEDDAAIIAFADRLLVRVASAGDAEGHGRLATDLMRRCREVPASNWCWALVDRFVAHDATSAYAVLDLAIAFGDFERRAELERAVALADLAATRIAASNSLTADEARRLGGFASYARARALAALAMYHDDVAAESRARDLLAELSSHERFGAEARVLLFRLHEARGRAGDAERVLDAELAAAPENSELLAYRLWSAIRGGDRLRALARLDALRAAKDDNRQTFSIALGGMVMRVPGWDTTALDFVYQEGHHYRDYALIILAAFIARDEREEAVRRLAGRTRDMAPASWGARMRAGDLTAWRELLVGYVHGEVPRAALFDALGEEARFASSDFAGLPVPRRGLLCEAHFYDAMRARIAGDRAAMLAALRAAADTGYTTYHEYSMARFLLAEEAGR